MLISIKSIHNSVILFFMLLICSTALGQETNGENQQKIDLEKIFPDPLTMTSDKYTVKRIDVKNNRGQNIYGVAFIPNEAKSKCVPLVILSHGFSSCHRYHAHYAQRMAENGVAMYIYDFCGGALNSKSDGRVQDMSVTTERDDLKSVFRAARKWKWVDTKNIFLSGESQGGFVSAYAGAEIQKDIRGMVLLYPALHIPVAMCKAFPDVAQRMHEKGSAFAAKSESLKTNTDGSLPRPDAFGSMPIGPVYPLDAISLNTIDITRSFKRPVLIIHGDQDALVDITYAFQALKDYPNAQLKIIPGANHGFWGEQGAKASQWMLDFVKKQIK